MTRKILHLDLDAFFCAVEELRDPSLLGQAFAVGARPEERGVVASCSYAAREFGVHSAMPMATAVRLCPNLIIVDRHFKDYKQKSRQVMAVLHELTPLVEQLSIDEAFLDVSDLPDPAETLARQLQWTINRQLGLPCSLGVASNKLVAKIANNVGKATTRAGAGKGQPPNAIKVVPPGEEAAFLAPLPVRELWGVGPKTAEQLAAMGMQTISDIARWSEIDLAERFGKNGRDLARRARGKDDRPIETERETKSVSQETTFTHDVTERETLRRTLLEQSEGVGRRLRHLGLSGSTVKLKLRWPNFTTLTRQLTLNGPSNTDIEIYNAALHLFDRAWPAGKPVRLIGVGVSGFEAQERQLSLWDAAMAPSSGKAAEEPEPLKNVLGNLRNKFGDQIVKRGSDLKHGRSSGE